MPSATRRPKRAVLLVVALVATAVAGVAAVRLLTRAPEPAVEEFLTRAGDRFMLGAEAFAAAGSNNYRPMRIEPVLVDEIMRTAAENNFRNLRVWGFNDLGNADGTNAVDTSNTNAYFHYWDGDSPAYSDGESGRQKLDYVIASAKRHGIRLVIPFVNNWASSAAWTITCAGPASRDESGPSL